MKKIKIFVIAAVFLLLCAVGVAAGRYLYGEEKPVVNEDIYAWLEIPGTDINMPVVQVKAGDPFYTDHNAQRE